MLFFTILLLGGWHHQKILLPRGRQHRRESACPKRAPLLLRQVGLRLPDCGYGVRFRVAAAGHVAGERLGVRNWVQPAGQKPGRAGWAKSENRGEPGLLASVSGLARRSS